MTGKYLGKLIVRVLVMSNLLHLKFNHLEIGSTTKSVFQKCCWQAFRNLSVRRPKLAKPYSSLLNPPVRMADKGLSSFGITVILYTYRAYKTLFGPIIPNPTVWIAYIIQSSFGKPVLVKWLFLNGFSKYMHATERWDRELSIYNVLFMVQYTKIIFWNEGLNRWNSVICTWFLSLSTDCGQASMTRPTCRILHHTLTESL